MFKRILIVFFLCSVYKTCVGFKLKFNEYSDQSVCNTLRVNETKNTDNNKYSDNSAQNEEYVSCAITEEFPLTNGIIQASIDVKKSQNVELSLMVFKENIIIGNETKTFAYEVGVIRQQITVQISAHGRGYAIILGRAKKRSSVAVQSISFSPFSQTEQLDISSYNEPLAIKHVLANNEIKNNALQFPIETDVSPLENTIGIPALSEINTSNTRLEPATTIVTVPFPSVGGQPTTTSTTPLVTVPFPTVGELPTTKSKTPSVTVPFPTVGELPTTTSATPSVTVPFPTVGELQTTTSTTPLVTVPLPTVGELPTTTSTTPVVTIPFPTVGELPTITSTTPLVTVPFPTVVELQTTTSTTPLVTIPFPTIGELDFPSTTVEPSTSDVTTEETVWDGVITVPFPTVSEIVVTTEPPGVETTETVEETTPVDSEDVGALESFVLFLILRTIAATLVIVGLACWWFFAYGKALLCKRTV
ncbi:probable maltase-glucoamylase 2 [Manduca sexta]|uniref:probable maltase-glucoamylase 2 n=1 Tax=Manduca sexta TaxID=7130 RepID=UPI00188ED78E|nr:probable maltase-glucoamylase 2 [Manduca sexta]